METNTNSTYIYIYIYIYIYMYIYIIYIRIFGCCQKIERGAKTMGTFACSVLGMRGYKTMQ